MPVKFRTSVTVDEDVKKAAAERAYEKRTNVSAVVNELLTRWVNGEIELNHTQVTQ